MLDLIDIIQMELTGLYGQEVIREMGEIIRLYDKYEGTGQHWIEEEQDYKQTRKKTNYIKKLIKEEARFLFGKTPIFTIKPENDLDKDKAEEINQCINKILKKNLFSDKLIKAARDCFIGKRIAIKLHADKESKSLKIMFVPSLEFIYEPFDNQFDELKKIVFFHQTNQEVEKDKQRIWKQKYEMVNGKCILSEGIYNGYGLCIEEIVSDTDLKLSGIPCYVILNDGLLGDLKGESDIEEIFDNQMAYNKLASEDIDTLKKGMNRIIYGVDVEEESSKHFKIKPGAYWDVETSQTADQKQAQINTIPTDFGYDTRIENSLNRIKSDMHEVLNIPLINNQNLKGMMTSGKSMKALYWQLITRCEEKMKSWGPALEWLIQAMIEMIEVYNIVKIPILDKDSYEVIVENQYPLQEDEDSEKLLDIQQVNAQAMSRKTFIKKWNNSNDDIADEELQQISIERQILEESFNLEEETEAIDTEESDEVTNEKESKEVVDDE